MVAFGCGLVALWLWIGCVWLWIDCVWLLIGCELVAFCYGLVALGVGLVMVWLRLVLDWLWFGCGFFLRRSVMRVNRNRRLNIKTAAAKCDQYSTRTDMKCVIRILICISHQTSAIYYNPRCANRTSSDV